MSIDNFSDAALVLVGHGSTLNAEKMASILGVLGKGGSDLIPIFKQGLGEGVGAITSKGIKNLDDFGDGVQELKQRVRKDVGELISGPLGALGRFIQNPFGKGLSGGKADFSGNEKLLAATSDESDSAKKKRIEKEEKEAEKQIFR